MSWMVPAVSATGAVLGMQTGKTTGGGGAGTGFDGFLVRLAGFAEMHMDIDETGAGDEAGGVDFFHLLFIGGGERGDDFTVFDEEVADGVALGGGIDDAGVGNPEGGHGARKNYSVGMTCSGWPPAQR